MRHWSPARDAMERVLREQKASRRTLQVMTGYCMNAVDHQLRRMRADKSPLLVNLIRAPAGRPVRLPKKERVEKPEPKIDTTHFVARAMEARTPLEQAWAA